MTRPSHPAADAPAQAPRRLIAERKAAGLDPGATPVRHIAGVPTGLLQRCVRCKRVLLDYRQAQGPPGPASLSEARPTFFAIGEVVQDWHGAFVVADGPRGASTGLCEAAPVNRP